jgi:hypothetical protein
MAYQISYEAYFVCPKGHRFKAPASPVQGGAKARCPQCFDEWVAANVPDGDQVSEAQQVPPQSTN